MHKKKLSIQVDSNPTCARPPSKNSSVTNNITGTPVFGTFPEISKYGFPSGPIYLRFGDRRFGLTHIWQEHFKQYKNVKEAEPHVINLINSIIKNGEIFYENGNRNLVFKRKSGVLILELKTDGQNNIFYSIVTAFTNANSQGYKIGQFNN